MSQEQGAAGVDAERLARDIDYNRRQIADIKKKIDGGQNDYSMRMYLRSFEMMLAVLTGEPEPDESTLVPDAITVIKSQERELYSLCAHPWIFLGSVNDGLPASGKYTAERIVASYNACTGIPTTDLSPGLVQQLQGQVKALSEELEKARVVIQKSSIALEHVNYLFDKYDDADNYESSYDDIEQALGAIRQTLGTQPTGAADQEE